MTDLLAPLDLAFFRHGLAVAVLAKYGSTLIA